MPKWCDDGRTSIGEVYLGGDSAPDLYLGLYKDASEPAAGATLGDLTEAATPGDDGYDRILLDIADWVESPSGLWTNIAKAFIAAGGDWGQITGFFITDDPNSTYGRLIAVKHFPGGPYQISDGNTLIFTPIVTNQTSFSPSQSYLGNLNVWILPMSDYYSTGTGDYDWLFVDNAIRVVDWSIAGVWYSGVKGIPTYPVGITMQSSNPLAPYYVDATGVADCTAAIQAAIAACPVDHVVLLPVGIFRINGSLEINRSYIVLRGAGPGQTILRGYGGSRIVRIGDPARLGPAVFNQAYYRTVTSGATKGSNSITVDDASNILVGDMVRLDILNDDPGTGTDPLLVQPNYLVCNLRPADASRNTWMGRYGMTGPRTRCAGEQFMVTYKSGNTLTLHKPLKWTYDPTLLPQCGSIVRNGIQNSGIEDLTLELPDGTLGHLADVYAAIWCWANKIEFKNVGYRACYGEFSVLGFECRRAFFNEAQLFGGSEGYGVSWQQQCSDCLTEDCISDGLHAPFVCDAGGDGHVFGYNYSRRTYMGSLTGNWMINDYGSHGPHEWFNLYECNIGGQLCLDGYHGSGSHEVVLRNWMLGRDDGNIYAINNYHAMDVQQGNHYHSFIGNVVGESGYTGYKEDVPYLDPAHHNQGVSVLWKVGYSGGGNSYYSGYAADPTSVSTILRHGNYDYVSLAVEWDGGIVSHDIPASLYLSAKPSWFGSLDWPCIGPDVSGYHQNNPAKQRWDNYVISGELSDLFADI